MSRTAAPKQPRKSAGGKGAKPVDYSLVEDLFNCDLAKWPAQLVPGVEYTVTMPTDDRNYVYGKFHRAGQRWRVEIDVRLIGFSAMFRVNGSPLRRKSA